uniref:Uncharacterized protein n=1 Tax=Vespula pensylvanica TaxID=30213 RepID=A0A834NX99_VESPE|nr:hypothetical protein H0235_010451 [Vespula pensylvanica]
MTGKGIGVGINYVEDGVAGRSACALSRYVSTCTKSKEVLLDSWRVLGALLQTCIMELGQQNVNVKDEIRKTIDEKEKDFNILESTTKTKTRTTTTTTTTTTMLR